MDVSVGARPDRGVVGLDPDGCDGSFGEARHRSDEPVDRIGRTDSSLGHQVALVDADLVQHDP